MSRRCCCFSCVTCARFLHLPFLIFDKQPSSSPPSHELANLTNGIVKTQIHSVVLSADPHSSSSMMPAAGAEGAAVERRRPSSASSYGLTSAGGRRDSGNNNRRSSPIHPPPPPITHGRGLGLGHGATPLLSPSASAAIGLGAGKTGGIAYSGGLPVITSSRQPWKWWRQVHARSKRASFNHSLTACPG